MALFRAIAVFFVVSAFFMAAMAEDVFAASKRFALVIGNSDYSGRLQLPNAVGDARAIAAAFQSLGFEVTLKEDLKRSEFKRVLSAFSASAQSADEIVFYYAGHGFQYDGVNYLVPVDAKLKQRKSIPFENITLIDIVDQLNWSNGEVDGQKTVILLDACRNDPLPPNLREEGMPVGLAEMQVRPNTLIAFATQPGSLSNDGPPGAHSPFTGTLLKYIDTAGLSVARMMAIVGEEVSQATHNTQNPTFQSKIAGAFYLKPSSFVADNSGDDGLEDGIVIGSSRPDAKPAKPAAETADQEKPKELKLAARVSDDSQLPTAGKSNLSIGAQAILPSVKPEFEQEIDTAPAGANHSNEIAEAALSSPVTASERQPDLPATRPQDGDTTPDARSAPADRSQEVVVAAAEVSTSSQPGQAEVPAIKPQFEQEIDTGPVANTGQKVERAATASRLNNNPNAPLVIAMANDGSMARPANGLAASEFKPERAMTAIDSQSIAPAGETASRQAAVDTTLQAPTTRSAEVIEQVDASASAPADASLPAAFPQDADEPVLFTPGGSVLKPVNEFEIALADPKQRTALTAPPPSELQRPVVDSNQELRAAIFSELRRLECISEVDAGAPEPALSRYAKVKSLAVQPLSQELLVSLQRENNGLCTAVSDNSSVDANAASDSDVSSPSESAGAGNPQAGRNSRKSGAAKRSSTTRSDNVTTARPAISKQAAPPSRPVRKALARPAPAKPRAPAKAAPPSAPIKKKAPIIIW